MASDASYSSVDQFLRDNGFRIDEGAENAPPSAGSLASASLDALSASNGEFSASTPPRFVLLGDDDLLLVDHDQRAPSRGDSAAGSSTGEKEDAVAARPSDADAERTLLVWKPAASRGDHSDYDQELGRVGEVDDSLDRSMLLGRSVMSGSSSGSILGVSGAESEQAAHVVLEESVGSERRESADLDTTSEYGAGTPTPTTPEQRVPSIYQLTPQADRVVSDSSSSLSSGRTQDFELSNALGVETPGPVLDRVDRASSISRTNRSSLQRKSSRSSAAYSSTSANVQTPRPQRALFASDADSNPMGSNDVARSRDTWDQYLSSRSQQLSPNTSSGASNFEESAAAKNAAPARSSDIDKEGEWRGLNDLLRKNGLPVVSFRDASSSPHSYVPEPDSLFAVIQDFVAQLDRKNEIIQDLVLESKRNSRVQIKTEGNLASVEKKSQEMQNSLDSARAEILRLKKKVKEEEEQAENVAKKLKAESTRLKQQLKVSEHRVKAKEVLVERMQQKLQQQVDKENLARTRERQVFRQLQDRDPRRANARDNQSLETIRIFESQREQLQEEIELLKSQVASLNAELRDKENFISRKAASENSVPVWEEGDNGDASPTPQGRRQASSYGRMSRRGPPSSVSSDEMIFEQLEAARREQELVAAKLRQREAAMIKKVGLIEQDLIAARETIAELKEENANLVLEAESRPSIRDYRLCQRRIHQLERQLSDSKLALEEAHDLNDLRKYMSTQELVERDRLNHRLQLNRLSALPRETALEVVQEVCRILHLTDITLIAPSLQKLCNVVVAVPRMEKFIRDVCGFVFLHSNEDIAAKDMGSAQFELEQVIPTLQQWMSERQRLHALEGFQASVITELCKRSLELTPGPSEEPSRPATLSNAAQIVSELVELERNVLQHREIYNQAAAEIERRPSVLVNQIVRHFSRLFQVSSIEGVLPKINEIYLFVNEMQNFLNVIRDTLGLKKQASVVLCINAVRECLERSQPIKQEGGNSGRDEVPDGNTENIRRDNSVPNYVVERSVVKPGQSRRDDGDLAGVREVRQMTVLIRALKRELGAASMNEILPRTKRLMELLSLSIHTADESGHFSD